VSELTHGQAFEFNARSRSQLDNQADPHLHTRL